ncbi:MAG: hypothetical protein KJI72_01565 [Patescibacteria group bacterium]|nr:hypothetical protein [Patescibacteria group bacterium]
MINDSRKGQTTIILAILIALGILVVAGISKPPTTEVPAERAVIGTEDDTLLIPVIPEGGSIIPEGGDTYYIQSAGPGPKIYEATMSPLSGAEPGIIQNWIVKVRYSEPVQSVVVTVIMDDGSYPVSLSLAEGTALDGIWMGNWEVSDTHEDIYQAAIDAGSGDASSQVVLTFQPLP